jgi:hypothetical protein
MYEDIPGRFVYRWRRNECYCGLEFDTLERFWSGPDDCDSVYFVGTHCPDCESLTDNLAHWWIEDANPDGTVVTWEEQDG